MGIPNLLLYPSMTPKGLGANFYQIKEVSLYPSSVPKDGLNGPLPLTNFDEMLFELQLQSTATGLNPDEVTYIIDPYVLGWNIMFELQPYFFGDDNLLFEIKFESPEFSDNQMFEIKPNYSTGDSVTPTTMMFEIQGDLDEFLTSNTAVEWNVKLTDDLGCRTEEGDKLVFNQQLQPGTYEVNTTLLFELHLNEDKYATVEGDKLW